MSDFQERDGADVGRLVDSAARTVAEAGLCWIATMDESGVPRLRPMGRLPPEPGDDAWRLRFITDGRSTKAMDVRRGGRVALSFQREAEAAFVGVAGVARLEEDQAEVRRRWKSGYDQYFPTEADKANAAFLTVDVDRLDLWIKGVTPEPFALKTTTLERDVRGWRPASDEGPKT
jgi:general stress protein 26